MKCIVTFEKQKLYFLTISKNKYFKYYFIIYKKMNTEKKVLSFKQLERSPVSFHGKGCCALSPETNTIVIIRHPYQNPGNRQT